MKQFAQYRLDTVNQCLWRQGDAGASERILVTPKAFAVLRYLVDHAGRLVTRDALLDAVWPDAAVEPEVLNNQILSIRNILGDPPKKPVFIETLPKRGYRFIAAVSDSAAPASLAGDSQSEKLAGRRKQLAELRDSLEKAWTGQCRIVFITGELGIGKTALADEFQRQAAATVPSIRIVRGQCVEGYGSQEPYYPMLEALGQLFRGSDAESVVRTLATQAPTWLVQFPALIKREHREMLQREIQGATRERMLREIGDALDAIAAANPLLIVFEDLQWADRCTVDLISAFARRRGPARLMILGTYRLADGDSANPPFKALAEDLLVHNLSREISLGPLTTAEITEYLTDEAAGIRPPDALTALLCRRSEGNPLFMVAALELLAERGLISRDDGGWHLKAAAQEIDLGVPEGLRKMIEAQIEQLAPEEQRVLEAASLQSAGRSQFLVVSRAEVIEMEPEAFEGVCERLSRRHSIVRSAAPEKLPDGTISSSYEFVHQLYRQVCYERIAPGRRAKMARVLGEWVESHCEVDEVAARLAGYFEQGGDWPRAIKYLHKAADTAGRRFAFRDSAAILDHALDLVNKLPEAERTASQIPILEKLATVYITLADDIHAIENYQALADCAARDGRIDVEVPALLDMAAPVSWTNSRRAIEILERAHRLSARLEDPVLRARMEARCFAMRLWQEWYPEGAEEFRGLFAEVLKVDDRRILARYLSDSGILGWISSEYREARRSLMESREIQFETLEESPYLSFSYLAGQRIALPFNLLFLGEWGEALREIDEAIVMLDKNADYLWGQRMRLSRAFVHLHAMDFAGVLKICNAALPVIRGPDLRPAPDFPSPYPPHFRIFLSLTGSAATALADYESSQERLLLARADMDRQPVIWDWWWRMPLESALTELWLAKGDLAQARPQAEAFLATALATAERTWQTLAWEANARVAMAAEDWNRAEECIAKALAAIEGFEVPLAAWRVHRTAAELYARAADGDSDHHPAAEHHRELSRATILKLANSLPEQEPLRRIFLSAAAVREIVADA